MKEKIEGFELTKSSLRKVRSEYKKYFGHRWSENVPKFAVLGNVRLRNGSVSCTFFNENEYQRINKYLQKIMKEQSDSTTGKE